MATYSVIELDRSGGVDEKGVRHYTRRFQVTTSNPLDGPAAIARQVPYRLYESYPVAGEEDPAAILKRVDVQPQGTLGVWTITLEYDSAPNEIDRGATRPGADGQPRAGSTPKEAGQGSNQNPPDQRPWVIKWGAVKTTKFLTRDYSNFVPRRAPGAALIVNPRGFVPQPGKDIGKPVVNAAGVPFDPPLEVPCSHTTVSITAFSSIADHSNIKRYQNKVNRVKFMGYKAWQARCTNYGITSQYEQGAFFWQIDVEVEFNEDGWNPVRVINAGTLKKELANPPGPIAPGQEKFRLRPIIDKVTGQPVTHPVPLDELGGELEAGKDPIYLEFQGYIIADFRKLLFQGRRRRGT
jgi:hypothetical protein